MQARASRSHAPNTTVAHAPSANARLTHPTGRGSSTDATPQSGAPPGGGGTTPPCRRQAPRAGQWRKQAVPHADGYLTGTRRPVQTSERGGGGGGCHPTGTPLPNAAAAVRTEKKKTRSRIVTAPPSPASTPPQTCWRRSLPTRTPLGGGREQRGGGSSRPADRGIIKAWRRAQRMRPSPSPGRQPPAKCTPRARARKGQKREHALGGRQLQPISQSAQFCRTGSEQNAITTDSQPSIQPDSDRQN